MGQTNLTKYVALAALFAAGALFLYQSQAGHPRAGVDHAAPDFQLADLNGRTVSLSSYKGRVVLLNFWASWCDSCKEEMPALNELYKRRRGADFELLAASVDTTGRQPVLSFAARYEPAFPILLADSAVQDAYAVRDLPTSFLIGPDGRIARRYVGPIDPKVVENDILELSPAAKKT
jgi:peroxiredoxin